MNDAKGHATLSMVVARSAADLRPYSNLLKSESSPISRGPRDDNLYLASVFSYSIDYFDQIIENKTGFALDFMHMPDY